ncbi:PhzF family phenazine biosynthesis protein [Embleya hyalina]|uniref:Oxidoreductase n=1 Tax=Embleya hyalina TaxID=516124 RepID=A0A401Z2X3_9ACTN|nr:PhzF family phenazine biosynthesis isomerase [Embleya hyalina]GCE01243.1 oxidoreductase [Embleya hyalina]
MTTPDPAPTDAPLRYTAFSTDPNGGNPAGVVLDAGALTDRDMLTIAAELGYSETAFLTRTEPEAEPEAEPEPEAEAEAEPATTEAAPTTPRAYTVRYFSPLAEVSFCGHATIAAAIALAERIGPGPLAFTTRAGLVPVDVTPGPDGRLRATLTSVEPHHTPAPAADVAEALALLGWSADDLDPELPPGYAYAGAHHLILAAATRSRLADLDYDFDGLAAFMRARDLTTLQLVRRTSADTFHVRDPFPVGGVIEDPATGAAAAALGHYLRALALVPARATLTLHQGDDLGRPGVLTVDLDEHDPRVRVSGPAVPIPDPAG